MHGLTTDGGGAKLGRVGRGHLGNLVKRIPSQGVYPLLIRSSKQLRVRSITGMMMSQIPQSLLDEFNARKVVLFVGSGLSAIAGLPLWDDLITNLKASLIFDDEKGIFLSVLTHLSKLNICMTRSEGPKSYRGFALFLSTRNGLQPLPPSIEPLLRFL